MVDQTENDLIGVVRCSRNESPTKLRGGYYTDADITDFLSRWVCAIHPKRLLEPSCGDGAFFEAISRITGHELEQLVGFEIESGEAAKAGEKAKKWLRNKVEIHNKDFLGWAYRNFASGVTFDGVLGNPPYIRYQYLDEKLQSIAEGIFKYHSLPFTKHTNAWVSFVVASIALLRPKGRLGMVLPAELLHVLYAQPLRNYLVHECDRILVVDPNELLFEGVLQGAVLLLAEKKLKKESHSKGLGIVQTQSRAFLKVEPHRLFSSVEYLNGETINGKWMKALLTKDERDILADACQRKNVYRFDALAEVDVGIVTGANKFFLVTDEIVQQFKLKKWAYPMFGRSEHVEGVIYSKASHLLNRKKGLPTNFIWFPSEPLDEFPKLAKAYIAYGEREGLPQRYKCRVRDPWYVVPSVYAAPVGMLKRAHDYPRLILNRAMAYTTDTAYRVKPKSVSSERLVFCFVNSLTVLSAELEGRHYGGGVLELVPSEIERLVLPIPANDKVELNGLHNAFRTGRTPEEILRIQDKRLLRAIGLSNHDIETIFGAWNKLRRRRQRLLDESEL
jgi:adenine-specific DNA-methyltransferase